jgi:hypothetical protein
VIGWRPSTVACNTVARPLYVTEEEDVAKNAGRGAAGFRASEHAQTSSAATRTTTDGE